MSANEFGTPDDRTKFPMSEQDDNRKAQSEALGRALAEAMDGDRLHPDNQPQVGTCPNCGGSLVSTSHGPYCPNQHCKWGWEVEMDGSPLKPLLPQPTPAEPRIETLSTFSVPMADVIRVIEALTGPTGGWLDSPRVVLGKIREHAELWRARAGSSLIAEPEKSKLTTFVCDCGRKLLVEGQVIGKELGASPPSSPGAAQTVCESNSITYSASGTCEQCGGYTNKCGHSKMRIFSRNCNDGSGMSQSFCALCERDPIPGSSPGAPQEQK